MARSLSGPAIQAGLAPADAHPHDVDDLCCLVTLSRMHPSDCGQRQVFARLDGGSNTALVYGEYISHEVKPGSHRLRVHNTLFWKNLQFSIEPGEHLEFVIINSARWWTFGMAGFLGSAPLFLTVKRLSVW